MWRSLSRVLDPRNNRREFLTAAGITGTIAVLSVGIFAAAQTVTLSVQVLTALTFTSSTANFSTINPGTVQFATTTLSVTTNDVSGWNVTLYGGNKGTGTNNLQTAGNAASIPDQTEWIPNSATSSAGNAVRISTLQNSGNVLAYRVMTASSSNGTAFTAPSWWGTTDCWADASTCLWGGISSSTVQRQIGNAGAGSYSSSAHLNSVQYYLNVSASQQTGTYNAPLTYTATGN